MAGTKCGSLVQEQLRPPGSKASCFTWETHHLSRTVTSTLQQPSASKQPQRWESYSSKELHLVTNSSDLPGSLDWISCQHLTRRMTRDPVKSWNFSELYTHRIPGSFSNLLSDLLTRHQELPSRTHKLIQSERGNAQLQLKSSQNIITSRSQTLK